MVSRRNRAADPPPHMPKRHVLVSYVVEGSLEYAHALHPLCFINE